ncbi:MAG: ABC transporter ATP-binding protein [Chloroflexota bacterium]
MLLTIQNLSKTYGQSSTQRLPRQVQAVVDLSFQVETGEFLTIIGPSGCGKSTLFRLLAGLEEPESGEILLQGIPLPQAAGRRGRFGYMPQRDALLPWRTVLNNVILGAELAGENQDSARNEARELLPLFGLEGFENAWPSSLSGGMRQRAALLRTFLARQEILLLDEPFGALDALTRRSLQQWLLDVRTRFQKTILFITHDIDEALLLGDRVLVFSPRPGRIAADLSIDLPHPRHEETILDKRFLEYKRSVMASLGTGIQ